MKIKFTLESQSNMQFLGRRRYGFNILTTFFAACYWLYSGLSVAATAAMPDKHHALAQALKMVSQGSVDEKQKALAIIRATEPKPLLQGADPMEELTKAYQLSASTKSTSRGHLSGPLMRTAHFSGDTESFDLVFEGGELATVTLHNEDSLSLKIFRNNTEICHEKIINGIAHCQWIPPYSTQYTIGVFGHRANRSTYTLLVD